MSIFLVSLSFLVSASQPPSNGPAAQATAPAATVAEAPKPEPKMICKYEHTTGSRLSKQKVCRPEGQSGLEQDTALQRELNRNGDFRDPSASGFGN